MAPSRVTSISNPLVLHQREYMILRNIHPSLIPRGQNWKDLREKFPRIPADVLALTIEIMLDFQALGHLVLIGGRTRVVLGDDLRAQRLRQSANSLQRLEEIREIPAQEIISVEGLPLLVTYNDRGLTTSKRYGRWIELGITRAVDKADEKLLLTTKLSKEEGEKGGPDYTRIIALPDLMPAPSCIASMPPFTNAPSELRDLLPRTAVWQTFGAFSLWIDTDIPEDVWAEVLRTQAQSGRLEQAAHNFGAKLIGAADKDNFERYETGMEAAQMLVLLRLAMNDGKPFQGDPFDTAHFHLKDACRRYGGVPGFRTYVDRLKAIIL